MLKNLDSDIKLRLIRQVAVSLPVEDAVLNTLNWSSGFAGCWQDDRVAEEIVDDIREVRTLNREIEL